MFSIVAESSCSSTIECGDKPRLRKRSHEHRLRSGYSKPRALSP